MRSATHANIAAASALFVMTAAAANVGVAGMYSHGVARLASARSIEDHDIRVFTRPLQIAVGDRFRPDALEAHLRGIGYYNSAATDPGCFLADGDRLTVWARYPEFSSVTVQWTGETVSAIADPAGAPLERATIEPERMLTLTGDAAASTRASSEPIPLAALAGTPLLDAIIASEDRGFLNHHGLDFQRLALVPLVGGGGSTITMQVARLNVLQDRRRTLERKVMEIGVAMAMERRHSKAEILTAYVNSVYLGAVHGRALHGFGAAARELFNVQDVRELTPLQAVTLVALLNQPSRYLDQLFGGDDTRLRRQRNRVLRLMHRIDPGRYPADWVAALENQPVVLAAGAADNQLQRSSRHYLDYALAGIGRSPGGRVYLTLDPELQRIANEVVEQGLLDLDRRSGPLARRRTQAALIVTRPSTGDVLAMVGGRAYDESQFNRALNAERQLGSIMKPFDYLAAFERAADEGRRDITAETVVVDEPTEFRFPGLRPWRPANYGHHYAGAVTWRRALAESRNVAAVKVARWGGIDRVAALWHVASGQRLPPLYPSMTLGAIQATPAEVARAYAMFATGGVVRPLRTTVDFVAAATSRGSAAEIRVARQESSEAVREMMRAVLDEGTARAARTAGFTIDAAGKTGTTDDLRDAWFAGFSGDLLAVVWVGHDGGQPLGLTGAQAALPIWTAFMKRAFRIS